MQGRERGCGTDAQLHDLPRLWVLVSDGSPPVEGASRPTYVLDEDEELANLFTRPSLPEVDYSQPAPF